MLKHIYKIRWSMIPDVFWFKFPVLQPGAEYAWTSCSQIISAIQWFMVDGLCSLFCRKQVGMNILPKLTDGLNHPMVSGWWFMFYSSGP